MWNRTTEPGLIRAQIVLMILIVCAVTACASERVALLPNSEKMVIRAKIRPTDGMHANADRNSVAMAERVGAQGGAAAGAAWSLTCGPAILFCFPFFATAGAILGATTGSVAGAASDGFDLFPPKIAEQVEAILVEIEGRRDFFFEMRDALVDSVPQDRQADLTVADVAVYVGPESFELVQDKGSLLALRVTASFFAEWKRGEEASRTEARQYAYVTSTRPLDYWLHNDGEALDEGFTECVEKIAQMMLWDLAPPGH